MSARQEQRRASLLTAAVAALAIVAPPAACSAADWLSFEPASYESTTNITVDGKELAYRGFSAESPLRFSIEGPTRVKVLVRLRVPADEEDSTCVLDLTRDGAIARAETLSAGPTERGHYVALEGFRPSVLRRIYIDVPTGRHGFEVRPRGPDMADARLFRSARKDPSRVSLAPTGYASVETMLHRDRELVYYLADRSRAVTLEVAGPTTIKVNSRLVCGAGARGRQTYALSVSLDGGGGVTYRIETEPSETVTFRDRTDAVPGALRYFMLDVPDGGHTYGFRVDDTIASGVALKFYIPRGDLLNEP